MKRLFFIFLFTLLPSIVFCQTKLYVDPEFPKFGYNHKIIAVIPFKTSILLRPKQMASLQDGQLNQMERDEGVSLQMAMYAWFLKRRQQGSMWVEVQDASTTNAILNKEGIDYDNIENFTPQEIAQLLGVDAIVRGTFKTNKPMSEGASIAVGLLIGFYFATNEATINMFIHNALDGKVSVNYNKAVSGSIGTSTTQLVNILMRKASRRIPYTKPKG